jgi:hypothetical protein
MNKVARSKWSETCRLRFVNRSLVMGKIGKVSTGSPAFAVAWIFASSSIFAPHDRDKNLCCHIRWPLKAA